MCPTEEALNTLKAENGDIRLLFIGKSGDANMDPIESPASLVVEVLVADFLTISQSECVSRVEYVCQFEGDMSKVDSIILDPSCSGSGLPQHCKSNGPESLERVAQLARIQGKLLLHALVNFPSVHTICYSTCSIFREENENVVRESVARAQEFGVDFRCVSPIPWLDQTLSGLNIKPEQHKCRGFFIAKLERN